MKIQFNRMNSGELCCWLNNEALKPYGLTVKMFHEQSIFEDKILVDLENVAKREYGLDYEAYSLRFAYDFTGENVVFFLRERNKILYMQNDFIEEEDVVNGIMKLVRNVADDKIITKPMEGNKRREFLEKLRTDKEFVRKHFM